MAYLKALCDEQMRIFLEVCAKINFPVAINKMVWGTTFLTFLGLLLDTKNQLVCVLKEKVEQAMELVVEFIGKKKITVHKIQKLCGMLNFLCRCIVPGCAFLRRTYSLVSSKLKPHHHVSITSETKNDMKMWLHFLNHPKVFSRPFMDFTVITAKDINMYSDAAKPGTRGIKGFGAICDKSWMFGPWDPDFIANCDPSIEYLELFVVTAAVVTWIRRFKNKRIYLFCDNESAVHMINNSSSNCKNCMVLIRMITLESLIQNVRVYAKHVSSKNNGPSDTLSRLQLERFHAICPDMEQCPTPIPHQMWPVSKI